MKVESSSNIKGRHNVEPYSSTFNAEGPVHNTPADIILDNIVWRWIDGVQQSI